jgi:hypothetical protein
MLHENLLLFLNRKCCIFGFFSRLINFFVFWDHVEDINLVLNIAMICARDQQIEWKALYVLFVFHTLIAF